MAKHVIFLVHGMGACPQGWSQDTQAQIAALYSAYDIAKEFPFGTFFHFEEITYNNRFDALRKQWRTDSEAVLATLKKGGLQDGAAVELAKAGGIPWAEDEFLSTHVLDVILYRFVPMIAEEARNVVAQHVLQTLFARSDPCLSAVVDGRIPLAPRWRTTRCMRSSRTASTDAHCLAGPKRTS